MQPQTYFGDDLPLDAHIIEMRLRDLRQLFDSRDPSPFLARDLDDDAQQYIIASVKEVSSRLPLALVIHLSEPVESSADACNAGEAVREHFNRQAGFTSLRLRQLIHHGWISLAIGLAFMSAALTAAAALTPMAAQYRPALLVQEGLQICSWVAMWRPIQIFLYDWWPIWGELRLFNRLGKIPVQIIPSDISAPPAR